MYQNTFDYDDYPDDYGKTPCDCDCEYDCEYDCNSICDHVGIPKPEHCFVGPTGPMGPRGARGPQGPRGIQGQQGREGSQGPRGLQGVTGSQGVMGVQGPTGSTGAQGIQGLQGNTGASGVQGPKGDTGPAGAAAQEREFASVTLQSFTDKQQFSQEAIPFDVGNVQNGFTIADNYQSVQVLRTGTYVLHYGCVVSSVPCNGDAIALVINNTTLIEESRMPILGENTFVTGCAILTLQEKDTISLVTDCVKEMMLCSSNNTVNAYLAIYQIN